MSSRLAQRWCTAAVLAAAATTAGVGAAHASTAIRPASVAAPAEDFGDWDGSGWHHHHHGPNCNNDPDSEFANDPDFCTQIPPEHSQAYPHSNPYY